MLTQSEIKEIDKKAEKAHYAIFGQTENYDNLEDYLEYHGIDVRWISSDELDGYLRYDAKKDCPVIVVSISVSPPVNRRYVMAYQLGYLLLKYDWDLFDDTHNHTLSLTKPKFLYIKASKGIYGDKHENEVAKEFASTFLIPNDKLKPYIDNATADSDALITDVSIAFHVSTLLAKYKILSYLKKSILLVDK